MVKPLVICLTPVKNEAWILDTFLQCTSLWADYIIIADQQSTDGSREIALKYPRVILIDNPSAEYNEVERQKLLLAEARKIEGQRLLITLDADEFFTSGFAGTTDWNDMLQAKPGQVFGFKWINLLPGYRKCWYSDGHFPWAFMDNGDNHQGEQMHNPRVPVKHWDEIVKLNSIKVLHFQYVNWLRMQSKHRYYQCLEKIKYPLKHPVDIFRTYHHMYAIPANLILNVEKLWFQQYEKEGIGLRSVDVTGKNWFDNEVLKLFDKYGSAFFTRSAVWNTKWPAQYKYPGNVVDKTILAWLKITQKHIESKIVKYVDRVIKYKLWKL